MPKYPYTPFHNTTAYFHAKNESSTYSFICLLTVRLTWVQDTIKVSDSLSLFIHTETDMDSKHTSLHLVW